jgi:hypothetical protein
MPTPSEYTACPFCRARRAGEVYFTCATYWRRKWGKRPAGLVRSIFCYENEIAQLRNRLDESRRLQEACAKECR